ncbi:phospholipase D-like domain-containing protein [Nocardioides sp. R-C-SC26]|uniref:phospholipase D-like domain-containing protein n=1 Tax=Nocardioides sp. R-C-SC26 TaxID=2870414 RepID=UPI001E386DC5|nr:phospholipase D-like domain-containing protein [Nocardioides sp. R-C-SC26]
MDEGKEAQNTTFATLVSLIDATPPGERIRITGNSFTFLPAADALVAAHRRGVDVQVLLHRVSKQWSAYEVLRGGLGADPTSSSFVRATRGGLHQKVWSFSRTADVDDVVALGSMNLTYQSARQYTDVALFTRRPDLLRVLDRRFEQLRRELPDVGTMSSARLPGLMLWFYPGFDQDSDPVRVALEDVPASGARIRIAMYAWLDGRGIDLARLLAAKAAAGAEVEVFLGPSVGARPRQILEESRVEVYDAVFENGQDIHLKLTTLTWPDPTAPRGRRWRVLTGSDNYTSKSLERPEVLVGLDGHAVFRRYQGLLDALVRRAVREGQRAR